MGPLQTSLMSYATKELLCTMCNSTMFEGKTVYNHLGHT